MALEDNVVKIVDFGLSTFAEVDDYLFKRCGTPGYVAPEVINADKEDKNLRFSSKSDVFSAGIIFYFMLTGKIPYDGKSFSDVLKNNKRATIDFNVPCLSRVPPKARNLLENMLRVNEYERFSPEECLGHPYFTDSPELGQERRDSINLGENLKLIKYKYTQPSNGNKYQDSIKFNAKPDVNGRCDTIDNIESPQMGKRTRIDSINSQSVAKGGSERKDSIYKRALLGGKVNSGSGSNHKSRDSSIDSRSGKQTSDSVDISPNNVARVSRFA